jgi:putative phosphonate transport system ATP-binding protein
LRGTCRPIRGQVIFDTRAEGPRDVLTMSEPERRMLGRTDWAFVHQNPRDGLRMRVSAGGNVGERLMAVGARHYGGIRATRSTGSGGWRSTKAGSTTGPRRSRAACSSGCRSRATS